MRLKSVLLLGLLTGLILGAGYLLGGQNGLVIALVFAAVMNLGSYWFSDKIVLSMYNAKPIEKENHPRLHQIIKKLAEKSGIPKPKIYMVPLPVPNAFATGRNPKHAVVAVTQGIVELLNDEELEGVLAHELSHIKNHDILVSSIAATLAGAVSMIAQMAYFGMLFGGGGRERNNNILGAIALIIVTPIMASLIHLAISRSREFLADESGAKISGKPGALISALKKIHAAAKSYPIQAAPRYEATAHMFIANPFKASTIIKLLSTHPPLEERVKRLEKIKV